MMKIMKKKVMFLTLTMLVAISMVACNSQENQGADTTEDTTTDMAADVAVDTTANYMMNKYRDRALYPELLIGIEANVLYFGYEVSAENDELQHTTGWFSDLNKLGRVASICDSETWNQLRSNESIVETFSYSYEESYDSGAMITPVEGATRVGQHYVP